MILLKSSNPDAKTIRLFSHFELSKYAWDSALVNLYNNKNIPELNIFWNESGYADLVIVFDYTRNPYWFVAPSNRIIKYVREPMIKNVLTHRFTYIHEKYFSKIYTSNPRKNDKREVEARPLVYHNSFKLDSNLNLLEQKKFDVSIISSTLQTLKGHRERTNFVNKVLESKSQLEMHLFGKGRKNELIDKSEGLIPYRFSIAIENSSINSWITEKFTDCILCDTIPVYFGAPNISNFFPSGCFVWLPIDDISKSLEILDGLNFSEYKRRAQALKEAKAIIGQKYSLFALVQEILEFSQVGNGNKKFVLTYGVNSLASGLGLAASKLLRKSPIKLQTKIRNLYEKYLEQPE